MISNKPRIVLLACAAMMLGLLVHTAYAVATFNANLKITNPGEALTSVGANFTLPDCLTPTSVGAGMTWNASTKVLSIYIGNIGAGETKSFPITFQAASSGCYASGQIMGELVTVQNNANGTGGTSGGATSPANEQSPSNQEVTPPTNEETPPANTDQNPEAQPVPEPLPPGLPAPENQEQGAVSGGSAGGGGGYVNEGGGYVSLNFLPSSVTNAVINVRSAPKVAVTVRSVVEPITQVVSAVSATVVTVNAAAASSHILFSWFNYLRFLFLGFLKKKKGYPWGRVYNESTQAPIMGASVSVIETLFHRVKETQITDAEGRFGFLATPGNYALRVSRTGFQSRETSPFTIGQNVADLNLQIGLSEERAFIEKTKAGLMRLWNLLNSILYTMNPYFLLAGGVFSLAAFIIVPTKLNLGVLVAYVILGILKILVSRKVLRSYGVVFDAVTRQPIPLGVVRLYNADKNWLLGTRVSDDVGRFNFLLLPGRYYLTCVKVGYMELKTGIVEMSKAGIVDQTLIMSPIPTTAPQAAAPAIS